MLHDTRSAHNPVMTLKGHDSRVTDVQMDEWKVASGRYMNGPLGHFPSIAINFSLNYYSVVPICIFVTRCMDEQFVILCIYVCNILVPTFSDVVMMVLL